ncbi:hypothetical protein N0V90_011148 [Kalmusia sp. IMI 367209]|nr:hypothetical protein N0V90_011148 [Kalmusia sp. IMI 367209]
MQLAKVVHESNGRVDPGKRVLGNVLDILEMPCPHSDSIRKLWESGRPDQMDASAIWNVEIRYLFDDFAFCFFDESHPETKNFYRTFNIVAKPGQNGHTGASKVINSQWIDPLIPRSWYATCLDLHGSRCEEPLWAYMQPSSIASPDWLIDVNEWCIVPYNNETARYLTLSYTWGNVGSLQNTTAILEQLRKPGSLEDQSKFIPQTVVDAMKITKFLGERYLWVDSLCIIQDDDTSLYSNLNVMHHIYARSTLCLVAFAGQDARHGLRGINGSSAPRNVDQVVLNIADGEQLTWYNTPRATWDRIGQQNRAPDQIGSLYNERGWTYQEFVFAKRRLIFTDGPLRWVCPSTMWGEDKHSNLVIDNMTDIPFTNWKQRRRPGLASLLTEVASGFNARHFRYHRDTLRAFLGIQNHLHGDFLGGLNYGHPDMFFDVSLVWEPDSEMFRRKTLNNASSEDDCPPSWSWMGWQGAFRFLCDDECYGPTSDGIVNPITQWFALPSPFAPTSQMRPIKCKWHQYKTMAREDDSLVPQGWVRVESPRWGGEYEIGNARFHYPVPIPPPTEPIEPIEQLQYICAHTTRAYFIARQISPSSKLHDAELCVELCTTDGLPVGFLRLHQKADEDKLLVQQRVELVAVVKGWTTELSELVSGIQEQKRDKRHSCYYALCIEWENGVAKRRASGKVFTEAWERSEEHVRLVLG